MPSLFRNDVAKMHIQIHMRVSIPSAPRIIVLSSSFGTSLTPQRRRDGGDKKSDIHRSWFVLLLVCQSLALLETVNWDMQSQFFHMLLTIDGLFLGAQRNVWQCPEYPCQSPVCCRREIPDNASQAIQLRKAPNFFFC